jgi:gag-polyprotein putative aspartyl protease
MWVQATVNGKNKAGIFDTGADGTAIDSGSAEELGLMAGQKQSATGVAGDIEAFKTDPISFGLGDITLTADEANIVPLSKHVKGLDFILGFDALRSTPFLIDYLKDILEFGTTPNGTPRPFVFEGDIRPTTRLDIVGATLTAMLDTGSGAGIILPQAWVKANLAGLKLGESNERPILGSGYQSQPFELREASLGGVRLVKVAAQAVAAEDGSFGDQESNWATVGNVALGMLARVGIDGNRRLVVLA